MTKSTSPASAEETEPQLLSFMKKEPVPLIRKVAPRHLDQIREHRDKVGTNTIMRFLRANGYKCSISTVEALFRDLDAGK
jgi:hypothetical protein